MNEQTQFSGVWFNIFLSKLGVTRIKPMSALTMPRGVTYGWLARLSASNTVLL